MFLLSGKDNMFWIILVVLLACGHWEQVNMATIPTDDYGEQVTAYLPTIRVRSLKSVRLDLRALLVVATKSRSRRSKLTENPFHCNVNPSFFFFTGFWCFASFVFGHSLDHLLNRSHRSLMRLLCTAHCAHTFARSLTHAPQLPSSRERGSP